MHPHLLIPPATSALTDWASTVWLLGHGGDEINPALGHDLLQLTIVKGITTGVVIYSLHRLAETHPCIATVVGWVVTGLWGAASIWNVTR